MADRYQDRPYPADDGYDRGDDQHAPGRTESDPLAELARLIGQTDPFANLAAAPISMCSHAALGASPIIRRSRRTTAHPPARHPGCSGSRDRKLRHRMIRQTITQTRIIRARNIRCAAMPPSIPSRPDYGRAPPFAEADQPLDPSRYDDALYGQIVPTGSDGQHDPAYSDDAYGYQDGYDEDAEEPAPKRRGGLTTVMVVLALAVVGTGGAFAYRTYFGSPRSGEPPIIKADTSPTKIVPAPADANAKVPDRLAAGDGTEKIVPREEAPVDVNANTKAGPRMVFPPLNQNANPPSPASVAPNSAATDQCRQWHHAEQPAARDQDVHGSRRPAR